MFASLESCYVSYLDGISVGLASKIQSVKFFANAGVLAGLFPNTIHVVIENRFYMKFSNNILPRRRSVNDDCVNVLVLEDAFAELVFLSAVEYLLCKLWLN